MKMTELNGMIVLTPDLGKLIRNKNTDNYSTKVYIGKNVSMNNYEEVDDETISESLKQGIIEIQNREQSLTKIGKIVAKTITDDKVADSTVAKWLFTNSFISVSGIVPPKVDKLKMNFLNQPK